VCLAEEQPGDDNSNDQSDFDHRDRFYREHLPPIFTPEIIQPPQPKNQHKWRTIARSEFERGTPPLSPMEGMVMNTFFSGSKKLVKYKGKTRWQSVAIDSVFSPPASCVQL